MSKTSSGISNGSNGVHNGAGYPAKLDASKLETNPVEPKNLLPIPNPQDLIFGEQKTDHMLIVEYDPVKGWGAPRIQPYQPLALDPASHCLHYGSVLFEGMKAFLSPDGTPLLFRPDLNVARMNRSAARLSLPSMEPEQLITLIKKFVAFEKRWIPSVTGYSLYIRPTLIATRPYIGLTSSDSAMFYIIVNPAGSFFRQDPTLPKGSVKPISLFASYDHVRAWPGGTGAYKVGGNYAPCFMPQELAAKQGYQQILWLLEDADPVIEQDGVNDIIAANGAVEMKKKSKEMRITEAGQMNFFAVLRRPDGDLDLVTPPLDGTVLPGVTRQSVLDLARFHNLPPSDPQQAPLPFSNISTKFGIAPTTKVYPMERVLTIEQLYRHNEAGEVVELFGAGTAAIICPIGRIGYKHQDIVFPTLSPSEQPELGGYGVIGKAMLTALQDIYTGVRKSDWSVRCE